MHDIDRMLKLNLAGHAAEARAISDKIEAAGQGQLVDYHGNATQDIWMRHCFNRGWFIIQDGDYRAGCQLLENGRFLNVYGNGPLKTAAPLYNPETHDIRGKSIIVSLEGGLGDEIIHARFATSFKNQGADKVWLAAAPELVSVLGRISGVDGVILRNQAHLVKHDFWVPGFSAGWIAGHTFDNFPNQPYLTAKPESVEVWKSLIQSEKIKVGIRWAGNPKFEHQQFRRFPEEFMTNLAQYSELQFFSLQKDANIVSLPENVVDLQHLLLSWEDTLAAISNLDLVITSCTSIAHASAALGKETWVVVPVLPYHTWTCGAPESTTSPYYATARIFRQQEGKNWNGVFQNLYKALEEKFNLIHQDLPNEDRPARKVNLGSGLKKFEGFINVDRSSLTDPDQIVDLNVLPWPWQDNEFDHVVAKDILEHLGDTTEHFMQILKEMYRVSNNGAVWEIQVPHWRCDIAIDDPTHVRLITPGLFNLLNKKRMFELAKQGESDSLLAFDYDIDIEVCDTNFEYTAPWAHKIRNGLKEDELTYALNHFNNVALSTRILIQVHKPGRYTVQEVKAAITES